VSFLAHPRSPVVRLCGGTAAAIGDQAMSGAVGRKRLAL